MPAPSPARLALIGKGIGHSRSPDTYRSLLGQDTQYDLLDVADMESLPTADQLAARYDGVSITAPWKEAYAGAAVAEAAHLGAVNCLRFGPAGMEATNTDWSALKELLPPFLRERGIGSPVVILGNGAMARVARDVLERLGQKNATFARSQGDDPATLDLPTLYPGMGKKLVLNACSRSFTFAGKLDATWVFWDFNYGLPDQQAAVERTGATYVDGLGLLRKQAEHAVQFWNLSLKR